jgi:hydroxypyruvate reductase
MDLKKLREDARLIFKSALDAVDPINSVKSHLKLRGNTITVNRKKFDISKFKRTYVVGMGKASAAMAQALEELLGERLEYGVVNVKYGHLLPLKRIKVNEAGHPLPDESGLNGAREIIELLRETKENDLVFCLISGGGSALLPCPANGITLEEKKNVTKTLLECGATIHEINTIRKHISCVKGGRLARIAHPSTLISLILSDVVGDDLDIIASGPTVADNSTFFDCLRIINKYQIQDRIPASVVEFLERGLRGEVEETPKPKDPVFRRTHNVVIGSNILALKAAKKKTIELGYRGTILSSLIEGETKEVAKVHTGIAKEILKTGNPVRKPACIISGGETTVTIRGSGLGGRNQEFCLSAAIEIDGIEGILILSAGTDGTDDPTDAAGAFADGTTLKRARGLGLDAETFLRENNSYSFFKQLGDLFFTGPTLTNVMDIRMLLVY